MTGLIDKKIEGIKFMNMSIELPYSADIEECNFEFGHLELSCNKRTYKMDSISSSFEGKTVEVYFGVTNSVLTGTMQDLTIADINNPNLKIDFQMGNNYNIEPDSVSLYVKNGLNSIMSINVDANV